MKTSMITFLNCLIILLFFTGTVISKYEEFYIDNEINNPNDEKLKIIVKVPYEKMVYSIPVFRIGSTQSIEWNYFEIEGNRMFFLFNISRFINRSIIF